MIEAYPLSWPQGWKRTPRPDYARFGNHSIAYARDMMITELNRLGAKQIIISSNLKLRNDGLPYSSQKEPEDRGVCVYFKLNGENQCFPCDRWSHISHNLWAIYKSIEAIRGLSRWGAKDMVNAAFKGFQALPAPTTTAIRYFDDCVDKIEAKSRYYNYAKELHPDNGGSVEEFQEMKRQYEECTF